MAESLGETFPEIVKNSQNIRTVLDFEEESFKKLVIKSGQSYKLLQKDYPRESTLIDPTESLNFYQCLNLLDKGGIKEKLEAQLAFKFYEQHGMQEQDIVKLAEIRDLEFSQDEFDQFFARTKELSKISSSQAENMKIVLNLGLDIRPTDDSFKYDFCRNMTGGYELSACQGLVLKLVSQGVQTNILNQGIKDKTRHCCIIYF